MDSNQDQQRQILANHLNGVLIDVDLQFYKGSIYKLRWGSPGGLDAAIPCYRAARRALAAGRWPDEMREVADKLAERVDRYVAILEAKDVTSASAQHSVMMSNFEELQERARSLF